MSTPEQFFFMDTDGDGHWYLIPEDLREDWDRWLDLDEEDEERWSAPEYAKALGTHPKWIAFTNPNFVT